ncbi:Cro/CI family transcriptional regulator [Moraxella sp. ZJ142]|uniref:Cro/CI family transcriptional regulator n=1 Tax=Moraxella marmotae TaxID=3344520 RepID=UPI0035D4EDCD
MDYQELVNHFGSQVETARQLGITQPSVHAWLSGKARMGAVIATKAEIITNGKFKAVDLCPELRKISRDAR